MDKEDGMEYMTITGGWEKLETNNLQANVEDLASLYPTCASSEPFCCEFRRAQLSSLAVRRSREFCCTRRRVACAHHRVPRIERIFPQEGTNHKLR
jgi:hypothetical protein